MAITLINKKAGIVNPVITPAASNLLLSTNFAGTTGTGSFASAFVLTGTDSETGLVWPDNDGDHETPLNILYANLLHYYDTPPETINAASWPTYYAGEIQTVTGPDGTSEKALYLEVKSQLAPSRSQIELQLQRIISSTNTAAIGDLPHLYTSYWFKRPASVLAGMAVGNALVQFDYKSGGGAAGSGWYGGDARLIQELYKAADGNAYLRTRFDRNANGQASEGGTIANAPDGILPWTVSNFRYWQEVDKAVPVPFDQWVKYEMYIYRHPKNGIVLCAINDQIVCAHVGRTMGEFGNYWGRLFPIICYGTYAPNPLWACRLRFNDYPPAGSALQAPAADLLYRTTVPVNYDYLPISARHILIPPLAGIGHEIYGVLGSPEALSVYRQAWESGGALLPASSPTPRTDTGYPVIESVTEFVFATDSVNHNIILPPVNAGDGILIFLTTDGSSTVTTPGEWDKLYSEAYSTSVTGSAYALVADGSEGGTTVNFITSSAEKGAAQVYRISNWNGTLAGIQNGIVAENGAGTTADLPAINSYWGSAKTLWIGALHTSTPQTVSSAPTNYTNLTQTSSGTDTSDAQCITARRFAESASEDPGVFTMSGSGASKVYNTIAIAPAYAGVIYEHFNITREGHTLWVGMYTSQPHSVPDSDIVRAVIVVHGKSLDAAEYCNVVSKNMSAYLGNTIIVAPHFERNVERADVNQLFWGSSWPEAGRSSSLLPFRVSSAEVIDLLIAKLYQTFPNLEGVIIAGHSAGGQFCQRYATVNTDSRNRFLVSAPSSYAYPGLHRSDGVGGWTIPSSPSTYNDWKYGLNNLSSVSYVNSIGSKELRRRLIKSRVHYMVGALDNDPASSSLDVTANAMTQGAHRVERQSNYYNYLMKHLDLWW